MSGIPTTSQCDGNLHIASISARTYQWCALELFKLWEYGTRRGSNRVIPGMPGSIAYRRRLAETTLSLPFVIDGRVDAGGQPVADPWTEFETVYDYLVNAWVADPGTLAGTRAATLTKPSGATKTADIHVLALTLDDVAQACADCTLEIAIPAGRFT